MSIWTPPSSLVNKNDGDTLIAKDLKDLIASLQDLLNGNLGNPNINTDLEVAEKLAYAKLALTGAITDSDIVSVGINKVSTLKAKAQTVPNNTVLVQAGFFSSLGALATRIYAGGSSPVFNNTAGAGLNRIDVLTISDGGTLAITSGAEAASPVAPNYPADLIPICEVFVRFNAGGVIVRDTDNGADSYIKQDARPLIQFPGVADNAVTTAKLANGAAGLFNRVRGTDILSDPGTSYVTMTGMTMANFQQNIYTGGALDVALFTFDGAFEFNTPIVTDNYPMLEVRLMFGPTGSEVEVHKAAIDLRTWKKTSDTPSFVLPLSLSYASDVSVGGTKSARIEWRRTSGAAGASTVRQMGTIGDRVLSMTTVRKALASP